MRPFRIVTTLLFTVLTILIVSRATAAETQFPTRPVRLIVPTAPGGSTDLVARILAKELTARWGQTVVVENRAGAAGLIGLDMLAHSAPDGYTLAAPNVGHLVTAELSGKLSFKRGGDFTPVALTAEGPQLLVMHPSVSAKSLKQLVELARAKPRSLNYASGGDGSTAHLSVALFCKIAGIEMTHVAYKGTAAGMADLLAGRVQLSQPGAASVVPHIKAGRLLGLAVTGTQRMSSVPDVPTYTEAGYPNYDLPLWYGLFAATRMPPTILGRLNTDVNAVLQQPSVAQAFGPEGIAPGKLSVSQFVNYVATETVKWNNAAKAAGL